ncbi:VanW family protein [Paenibacillus sp. HB172176]|uniref:VanW family protein n=1 Tax=Paenibacillus sp. HB172176 TaxID=2493690 RepID=UPI00143A3B07|nr:VanW family protein [Paenibacillus sp. HB172176]
MNRAKKIFQQRWRKLLLGMSLILLFLCALMLTVLWKYASQDVVPSGVHAGRMNIGGMRIDEAIDLLNQYEISLRERTVFIKTEPSASGDLSARLDGQSLHWTAEELGYRGEFIGLKEALLRLKEGSLWERVRYRNAFPRSLALSQSWNKDLFQTAIRKKWSWIERQKAVDAERKIDENDNISYTEHTNAYRLRLQPMMERLDRWMMVQPEQSGLTLTDGERVYKDNLLIKVVEPAVTLQKLLGEGIDRKIMSYTTSFATSAEGRAYNVTVTAQALNDWLLAPGEIFSYSKLIESAEKQYSYREAPVILNGRLSPGIGGGICQVSSTLYQAALRAGLDIVERRNHSLPVPYLPLGYDATYATGAIDFKFRNSTDSYLLIRTEVKNRTLTVKLFGSIPENVSYDIVSLTKNAVAPSVEQRVNDGLPVGGQALLKQGKPGFIVDTYRIKSIDGKEVSRERISHDTYKAQPTVIEVGPSSLNSTPKPSLTPNSKRRIVEDGI